MVKLQASARNVTKKGHHRRCSSEFNQISQKTFFTEHLQVGAFDWLYFGSESTISITLGAFGFLAVNCLRKKTSS